MKNPYLNILWVKSVMAGIFVGRRERRTNLRAQLKRNLTATTASVAILVANFLFHLFCCKCF